MFHFLLSIALSAASEDVFDILEEEREVVEVSTRKVTQVRVAPAIVDVLTDADIHRLGIRTLGDVLELTTSVLLVHAPNGDLYPVVRGFGTENGVSVMMDGVPLLDTITGQFAHYEMPVQGLKRIEVLRGPGSALYGGNAQAAIINLVTHDEKRGEAQLMLGTGIDVRGNGAYRADLGKGGTINVFAAAQHDAGNALPVGADGVAARGDLDQLVPAQSIADASNAAFSATRQAPAQRIVGQASWQLPFGLYWRERVLFRRTQPLYGPGIGGGRGTSTLPPLGAYTRQDMLLLSELGFKRSFTDWLSWSVSLRHVMNQRDQDGQLTGPLALNKDRNLDQQADAFPLGLRERYRYRDHVLGLDTQLSFDLPFDNALMIGATATLALLEGYTYAASFVPASPLSTSPGVAPTANGALEGGAMFLLPNTQRRSLAFFAQDVFSPLQWLDVIAGARLDLIQDVGIISDAQVRADQLCASSPFGDCTLRGYASLRNNGKTYFQVNPRAGLVVKPPVLGLVGKLLYGHAFTPPPVVALTNQTPAENRAGQIFANPLLRPIQSDTFEAQVGIEPWQKQVIRVGYFHVRTSDEVVYDALTQAFLNNANRAINGLELELRGDVSATQWLGVSYRGGFTWTHTLALGGQLLGIGADAYPSFFGYGSVTFELFKHAALTTTVNGQSASRREAGDVRVPIPARALLSAQVRAFDFGVPGLEAGLIARNIAGSAQIDPTTQYQGLTQDIPFGGRSLLFFVQWSQPGVTQ